MMKGIGRKAKILFGGLLLVCFSMGANAALVKTGIGSNNLFVGFDDSYTLVPATADAITDQFDFITTGQPLNVEAKITLFGQVIGDSTYAWPNFSWSVNGGSATSLVNANGVVTLSPDFDTFGISVGDLISINITGDTGANSAMYELKVSAVAAVPVPGAAILFGSAVMAFGFISRRRKGMSA
ncbi:MAG: hypothetical protein ABW168_10910 [Sedimenticola sp.]